MNNNSITFICQTGYKHDMNIESEKASIEKEIKRCWDELKLSYKYNVYFFEKITEHKNNAFPGEIIRIIIISNEETRKIFFPYFFVIDKPVKHVCCNVTNKTGSVAVGYFQEGELMERLYSERFRGDVFDLSPVLKKIQNFTFTGQDLEDYNLQRTKVLVHLEPGFKAVYATNNKRIKPSKEWGNFDIFAPFVSHLYDDRISWGKDIYEMNSDSITARLKFYIFEVSDINNVEDDIVQFIKSYVGSPDACAGMNILILMNCNEKLEFKTLTTFFENHIYFKVSCEKKPNDLDTWIWTIGGRYTNNLIQTFDKMPVRTSEKNKELFDLLYSHKFSENKRSLKNACSSQVSRCINVYTKKELAEMKANVADVYKFTDLIHFAEYLIKYSFVENLIMAHKRGLISNIKYDDDKANKFKNEFKREFKPPTFKMSDGSELSMKYDDINALIRDKSFKINYASMERDIRQKKLMGNPNAIKQLTGNSVEIKSIQGGTGEESANNAIAIKNMSDRITNLMKEDPNGIHEAMTQYSTKDLNEEMYACKQYIISSICNSLNLCGHFIFININGDTRYFVNEIKEGRIKFLTQSNAFLYNIPYANHYIYFIFKHDYMKYALLYISQYAYKVNRNRQIKLTENKYIEKNPYMTSKEQRIEDKQNVIRNWTDRVSEERIADELNYINKDNTYCTLFNEAAYRFNDIDELEFIVNSSNFADEDRKYMIMFFVLSNDNHNKTELLKYLCLIANGEIKKEDDIFTSFMEDNIASQTMTKKIETLMIKDAPDARIESVVEIIPNKKQSRVIIEEVTEGGNQNSHINVIIIILFFVLLMFVIKLKKYDAYLSKKQFKSFT